MTIRSKQQIKSKMEVWVDLLLEYLRGINANLTGIVRVDSESKNGKFRFNANIYFPNDYISITSITIPTSKFWCYNGLDHDVFSIKIIRYAEDGRKIDLEPTSLGLGRTIGLNFDEFIECLNKVKEL